MDINRTTLLFQVKLKKKKNQDPSDTIGSVSVDDQEVYVDTAEGTDEVYMDTEANDGEIYNDVEEHTPEGTCLSLNEMNNSTVDEINKNMLGCDRA